MAKFTLDIVEDYPYEVFGLNTTAPDYRLCWSMNRVLGIDLRKDEGLTVVSKKKEKLLHNCFSYQDEELQLGYYLIENKRGASLFLPEVAQADFILALDRVQAINDRELIEKIKEIRSVLIVFKVDVNQLKQKQNLLFIG